MASKFVFRLGEAVKDKVTGFSGIINHRVQFLTGCNRYGVLPRKLTKDGSTMKEESFDENCLVRDRKGKSIQIDQTVKEELRGGYKVPVEKPTI